MTEIIAFDNPFAARPANRASEESWRDGFEAGQGYAHGYAEGADDGEAGRPAELPEMPDDATSEYRSAYAFAYHEGYTEGAELRRLDAERDAALSEIARLEAKIAAAKNRAE